MEGPRRPQRPRGAGRPRRRGRRDAAAPRRGYIVLGLADDGRLVGLGDAEVRRLDPAAIGDKLARYLTQTDVLAAVHEIEEHAGDLKPVALLYVHPSRDALAIFEADGTYPGPDGRERARFRKGEVFARHGTKTERWNQSDIVQVRERIRAQERERWAMELRADLPNLGLAAEAQRLAHAPAAALVWQMDGAAFVQTVIEQLRRDDDIPLTLLLTSVPGDASELLTRPDGQEPLSVLLDRLACLGATMLVIDRPALFDRVVQVLWTIYVLGLDEHGVTRRGLTVAAPVLFLTVLVRVVALGALAVRLRRWTEVRQLVLRRGEGYEWIPGRTWLTHASVMAARSDVLVERQAAGRRRRCRSSRWPDIRSSGSTACAPIAARVTKRSSTPSASSTLPPTSSSSMTKVALVAAVCCTSLASTRVEASLWCGL